MKKTLTLIILFLAIGFAAVSTTLILNGTINVGTNESDFDVYFSDAIVDENQDLTIISGDKKIINFETRNLSKVGDKSILEYEVTNASTQYDANVSVTCTPKETETYKVINTIDKEIIEARSIGNGTVTVELKKNVLEEQKISFTCTITASATERETADLGPIKGKCEYEEGTEWTFSTIGNEKFVIPCTGEYKVELWGAGGGDGYNYLGGKGAYVSGSIDFDFETSVLVYVGGRGTNGNYNVVSGGYNGGGTGGAYNNAYYCGGGGGATDIRLDSGLQSRIIVAAGGGGGLGINDVSFGGHGGTLIGILPSATKYSPPGGGTQTSGGAGGNSQSSRNAYFGQGGNADAKAGGSGGGGGYYGGGAGWGVGGAGGSSFISGHSGCNALNSNGTHTGQPNHYSGYIFTDTNMIAGNESMPTFDGNGTMTGNAGNGYAKITLLNLK